MEFIFKFANWSINSRFGTNPLLPLYNAFHLYYFLMKVTCTRHKEHPWNIYDNNLLTKLRIHFLPFQCFRLILVIISLRGSSQLITVHWLKLSFIVFLAAFRVFFSLNIKFCSQCNNFEKFLFLIVYRKTFPPKGIPGESD